MKFSLVVLFFLCSLGLLAQRNNGTPSQIILTGQVLEANTNQPLEYATIAVLTRNGEIVEGTITDSKGNYKIEIESGVYNIRFEYISYGTETLENQKLFKNTKLPTAFLALDTEDLDAVVVRAETTEVQVRLDKKIYTIGKDLTTSGATVSDALNNVPSVTVDVDGAINLRGNENVRILINGKPSAIAGFGSTDALRQLPAESIEKVEVITSPSARYDAEGTAGILNIILRKEKTLGFNGSIQTNIGFPLSSGITTNANLRTNKFNLFNTTGVSYRESPGNGFFKNIFTSENASNPIVEETRDYDRQRQGFNTNLGIEYFLTEKSSLTAAGFLRLGDNETTTTNDTEEFSNINTLAITRNRTEVEQEDDTNVQISLNYTNNLNDSGHKFTADFQWEKGDETERSIIDESNLFPDTEILPSEDIISKEDQTEYLVQTDYVLPIGENAQFEAGYRGRFQNTVTDYLATEQEIVGGPFIRNNDLSNIFDFTQNVQALYSQYGNKFGNFSVLLGLRLESTVLKGEVEADTDSEVIFDSNFDKDFLGLFPTANLTYELTEDENLTFGYNRRINRPRFWFLNPFPSRSSEANIFVGNPSLNPAYASAFDLGYIKKWGRKVTLTTSVYYQNETDSFERIQEDTGLLTPNGVPIIRTIPINLSTNERIGFEAGVLYNPKKWLRLNGSFNFFRFEKKGAFNGIDYGAENTSWFSRVSAKVTLPAKIDWQTSGFYRGPNQNAQTESEGIFSMNLAFSKDFFNDNATLGLNVRDLFNSRKRMAVTTDPNFRRETEFQWRERQFNLAFTYRFNQKKKRQRGSRGGGFEDEGGFGG